MIHASVRPQLTIRPRGVPLELGHVTRLMGILNVTPDSFSLDGCCPPKGDPTPRALRKALRMISEGADIIDIGGESTRPGAVPVTASEEARRVIPVTKALSQKTHVPVSIDTYKTTIAQQALDAGASIINNIKGTRPEKKLLKMICRYDAAVVLMHMRGMPRTMQKGIIHYHDVVHEILEQLKKSIDLCLETGIKSDRIIIDPGIGFGKTYLHNLEILKRLNEFQGLGYPVLVGTSRKSFIGKALDKDVKNRIYGTAATVCISILHGAHVVRVHDVAAMRDVADMTDAIIHQQNN